MRGGGQEADFADGSVADDPGVLAAATALEGNDEEISGLADAGEAAGHDGVGIFGSGEKSADDEPAGMDVFIDEDGCGKGGDIFLGDEFGGARLDFRGQFGQCRARKRMAEDGVGIFERERLFDDEPGEIVQHVSAGLGSAAPPGLDGGEAEILTEEMFAQGGKKGQKGGRLEDAGAEGVGDGNGFFADGLEETGNPEIGTGEQFERIAEIVVDATEDDIDALQTAEGLEKDAAVADGKIVALDQRVAEVSRR